MPVRSVRIACIVFVVLAAVLSGCAPAPEWRRVPSGVPVVRVLLAEKTGAVTLGADGSFRVFSPGDPADAIVLPAGETIAVEWTGNGRARVQASSADIALEHSLPIHVSGADFRTSVTVGGKPYRGRMEIREGGGGLRVINEVDVESYLRGVVPAEIGYFKDGDALEAVKAQAVAARTYALKRIGNVKNRDYDLVATVADQVYGGKSAEQALADRAVLETEGIVAVHRGKMIDAYYSSSCGGRTAAIRDVWDKQDAPYLRGVRDCAQGKSETRDAYCRRASRFEWTVTWDGAELERILAKSIPAVLGKGEKPGEIRDIKVKGTFRCGRVKTLEIRTTKGKFRVHGDRVRWVLRQPGNEKALWSAKFSIRVKRSRGRVTEVIATGSGFGHGVGMCQEGAIEMARQGKRFEQILTHYYPGIRLDRIMY